MVDCLRLKIDIEDDGTARLSATVLSQGFSGIGSAWFGVPDIEGFAHQLATTYPLDASNKLSLRGGYWDCAEQPRLDQRHLSIEFYPIGFRGEIGCRVELATSVQGQDRPESQHCVAVELRTTYEDIKAFGTSLLSLLKAIEPEAVLEAVAVE